MTLKGIARLDDTQYFRTVGIRWNITQDTWQQIDENGDAIDLNPADFNNIYPWGAITRVNIAPDGTINARYGDSGYAEDGSNGRVMVEIPRTGLDYSVNTSGDKIVEFFLDPNSPTHPAFNQRVSSPPANHLYLGAYEAHHVDDGGTMKLLSRAEVQPTTDANTSVSFDIDVARSWANNIGTNWGLENIHTTGLVRLLFAIEYGNMDSQIELGRGIVDKSSGTGFNGELTGADNINSNLNTALTGTGDGTDGLTPIAYRGIENYWGNVWTFVDGYEATDNEYRILNRNGDWNDIGVGIWGLDDYETSSVSPITDNDAYISDIETESTLLPLMIPSATGGSSSEYIPDYFWSHDSGQNNILRVGGGWVYGVEAGVSSLSSDYDAGGSNRGAGARVEFLK